MALSQEEYKKVTDRLRELSSVYTKYYWENQASEDAAREGKGKSNFPAELSAEIQMLNNMVLFGTPYNAMMAAAAAERQKSLAAQNSGGGFGSFLASLDPTTAISRELTNVFQPVEQTVSQNLA